MKKNLLLYGNTNVTKLFMYYIDTADDRKVAGITVEEKYIEDEYFEGIRVYPFEKIEEYFAPEETEILICIGYNMLNEIRQKVYFMCKEKGYSLASYIHPTAMLSNAEIGEATIILENTLIQPYVTIGIGNFIWCNVSIAHNSVIGDFNTIAGGTSLCGDTHIGNNTFLGNSSVIQGGIEIADYTFVGAAAFISKSTKKYEAYGGARGVLLKKNSVDILGKLYQE